MATDESRTRNPTISQRSPGPNNNGGENIFSPRFKSVAAMAGWDEETLLMASLIVDDTPDRENKNRKRPNFKTPPSNSRRKRRDQAKKNPPIAATILNLDDEEEDTKRNRVSAADISKPSLTETETEKKVVTQIGKEESEPATSGVVASSSSIPCLDKLREELSCAICLDICFEPSTTSCGHSFCKKCLRSAADKCGKRCPKCRQLIGNGRSCTTVNTVLWNTIQLLFPSEIEARKASSSEKESDRQDRGDMISNRRHHEPPTRRPQPTAIATRRRSSEVNNNNNRDLGSTRSSSSRRQAVPSQDEDAALALRLQREEFLEVVRVERRGSSSNRDDGSRISMSLARENLRAMASRAVNVRIRNRAT